MGIKQDPKTGKWKSSYSKRHPITKMPVNLIRKGIKNFAEAKRIQADQIVRVNAKIRQALSPIWRAVLPEYYESLERADITRVTKYNREKHLNYYTLIPWGDRLVNEITTQDILGLLEERLEGKADSYRKFHLKCVRGVFDFALARGWVERNPTPMLKFKLKSKIKSVLTEPQILLLLRKAQEQDWPWYPHYSMALFTGLRNGELYALTWDKVCLEKRQILVNRSWTSKDDFKDTKSGNDRIVEIPMPLLPLLRELKLNSAASEFVLPRLQRWDRGEQAYDLRSFLKAIGLHEVRFHDLRASWATWLLNKGVPPAQVMAMGGWADINTMMIYMRKAGIDIRNTTSVLDGIQTHGVEQAKVLELR